jgi:hypothetical protein
MLALAHRIVEMRNGRIVNVRSGPAYRATGPLPGAVAPAGSPA